MSFRIIHHEGDKNLLIEKVKALSEQIKSHEWKDDLDFGEGEWEDAVDQVARGEFDTEITSHVVHFVIDEYFAPASDDCSIEDYCDLVNKTSGKLAEILQMFVDGRNFSTGELGDGEMNIGYLTADEVKEFLELLKEYDADEEDEEFVDLLIEEFSELVEKDSGDLFTIG